jgi:hypothetical protein
VIKPAAGKKYDDFQLSYALDLLHGKMTVASATAPGDKSMATLDANGDTSARTGTQAGR